MITIENFSAGSGIKKILMKKKIVLGKDELEMVPDAAQHLSSTHYQIVPYKIPLVFIRQMFKKIINAQRKHGNPLFSWSLSLSGLSK